jgi:hypothetical protein
LGKGNAVFLKVLSLSNRHPKQEDLTDDVTVHTSKLYELNILVQDGVKEFALTDIDDKETLERKRILMHDAFTKLYDEIATFSEQSIRATSEMYGWLRSWHGSIRQVLQVDRLLNKRVRKREGKHRAT